MPIPSAPSGQTSPALRVLLVAEHALVRAGGRILLDTAPGITVVGAATTVAEALALAAHTQPEIILLDLDLRREPVAPQIPALLRVAPAARLVVLTGVRDPEQEIRRGGTPHKNRHSSNSRRAIQSRKQGHLSVALAYL